MEHEFPSIGYRSMLLNARQIHRPSGRAPMILLAIEDVTQRTRLDLARLAAAQEEERRRIAREIHDDLIQRLAGLAIDLGGCASKPPDSAQRLKKALRLFQTRVVEAAETGRRVAYELHPSELEDAGLEDALRAFCENISQKSQICGQVHDPEFARGPEPRDRLVFVPGSPRKLAQRRQACQSQEGDASRWKEPRT